MANNCDNNEKRKNLNIGGTRNTSKYTGKIKIENSCPKITVISNSNHKTKEGIAFVLNKELTNKMTWNHEVIINNKASRLTIQVKEERGLDIILIYTPNFNKEKDVFYEELGKKIKTMKNLDNILVMGDFNLVEEKID